VEARKPRSRARLGSPRDEGGRARVPGLDDHLARIVDADRLARPEHVVGEVVRARDPDAAAPHVEASGALAQPRRQRPPQRDRGAVDRPFETACAVLIHHQSPAFEVAMIDASTRRIQ